MESSQKFMKSSQWLLIALTLIFTAFIAGVFIGRNYNRQPVQIQPLPAVTSVAAPPLTVSTEPTKPSAININTATAEDLQLLPGIGPLLAERIIAYREENGCFEIPGELMNVPGIGEKKLEEIWDHITTGG